MNDGGLNEYLSDRYGTLDDAEDMQKSAEAEFFAKLAEEEGIDLDSLEEDELMAIADALGVEVDDEDGEDEYGEEEGEEELTDGQKLAWISKVAEANEIDLESLTDEEFAQLAAFALDPNARAEAQAEEEEFEAKMAEADFLGRTMAHAQFDEMRKISGALGKEAGRAGDALKAIKGAPGRFGRWMKEPGKTYSAARKGKEKVTKRYDGGLHHGREEGKGRAKALLEAIRAHKGQSAVAGGGVASAGGAAALIAGRNKKAEAEVVPVALDAEAIALLEEAGYEFE